MAKHSISEAIRLSGVGRTQFYSKYVKQGLISVSVENKKKYIDTSELIRVFGEIGETEQPNIREQTTPNTTEQESELVKHLREQVAELKADKEYFKEQNRTLLLRLDAPKKQPNWFSRWWNAKDSD